MNPENFEQYSQEKGGDPMSEWEQHELDRFLNKVPTKLKKQREAEGNGDHKKNLQANEVQGLITESEEEGHNDAILKFIEEGDKILFGVSEEEQEKWGSLPPDIKEKALEFYASLRHYLDQEIEPGEFKQLEHNFRDFLRKVVNSSKEDITVH